MAETRPPRVTVVTATYNGIRFLPAAIDSILGQTFADFEYVLVDDASTDDTAALLAARATGDPRLRVVHCTTNLGPAEALNRALAAARGEYVAVLDHDDLALPARLARQVAFLDAHPAIGAVGAQARLVDEAGVAGRPLHFPLHPAAARWLLLFGASLLHSATMYRRRLVQQIGGYAASHPYLCDYELLVRLVEHAAIANLPDELTLYRRSATQVSSVSAVPQSGQKLLLQYAVQLRWLGLRPDLRLFGHLLDWRDHAPACSPAEADAAIHWLAFLNRRYEELIPLDAEERAAVTAICVRRWLLMAHNAYPSLRDASRSCWQHACRLDPAFVAGREVWALLRAQRRRQKTPQPSIG